MRWHTKPITQLVVMFVVMSMVIGAQGTASALLAGNTQKNNVSQIQDTGLRKVAGNIADPTCPNTDAVAYAYTENRTTMAPPRRLRYIDARWEYDSLNTTYFAQTQEFDQAGFGSKAQNLRYMADDPNDDLTASTIMSSMFRYKPTAFKNAYILKYTPAVVRDDPSPYKGDSPAIEVPSKAGWPVCMPTTGYDIGGGYEAMVVFVDSNRITLHIGIHEYMDGDKPELGGCPLGLHNCRGGYWLYLSGINVDSDIVSAYNSKKGVQQGAGLSSNISDRIQLPIVKPGRRLGTSQGDGVTVLLRDSGPIIYANKNFMWGGGFPEYDPGGTPTNTPPANGTATPTVPPAGTPTTAPTAPPAGSPTVPPTLTSTPGEGTPTAVPTTAPTVPVTPSPGSTASPTPVGATPTPPPLPGVTSYPTQVYLTFEGSCISNPFCKKLLEVHTNGHNAEQGVLNYGSGTAYFNLGNAIIYTPGNGTVQFRLYMLTPIPGYNLWNAGTHLLLPSTDTTQYVIKP